MSETKTNTNEFARDREVIAAATEGPWSSSQYCTRAFEVRTDRGKSLCDCDDNEEDAQFMARARTRWPAALDEVERLKAENEQLKRRYHADVDGAIIGQLQAEKRAEAWKAAAENALASLRSRSYGWMQSIAHYDHAKHCMDESKQCSMVLDEALEAARKLDHAPQSAEPEGES